MAQQVLGQRSFDEYLDDPFPDERGVPLAEATFVKVRGGECLGTFHTLVNPGRAIPPQITVLTGLTDVVVANAPRIETVLGALVDFLGSAVFVAHNASFDLGFVRAALARDQRPDFRPTVVDTAALARRLLTILWAMLRDNTPWREWHYQPHGAAWI